MTSKQSPIFSFKNINFTYPNTTKQVLNDFSFEVEKGDVVAILGPNGSGKTTMLNLALGLYQPSSGEIKLNQKTLSLLHRKNVGEEIALVPQTENVNFEYTVREYLLIGRTPYLNFLDAPKKEDYDCVEKAIKKIGIQYLADKFVTNLSGGEFQLVLVARAITQQPSIMLLDEPTSHLDLANKAQLVRIVRSLQKEGITALLTTHDPQMAYRLATKVILMKNGQVYKIGAPKDVLTTQDLSETYDVPVEVKRIEDQLLFIW